MFINKAYDFETYPAVFIRNNTAILQSFGKFMDSLIKYLHKNSDIKDLSEVNEDDINFSTGLTSSIAKLILKLNIEYSQSEAICDKMRKIVAECESKPSKSEASSYIKDQVYEHKDYMRSSNKGLIGCFVFLALIGEWCKIFYLTKMDFLIAVIKKEAAECWHASNLLSVSSSKSVSSTEFKNHLFSLDLYAREYFETYG